MGILENLYSQRLKDAGHRWGEDSSGLVTFAQAWQQFQGTRIYQRLQIALDRIPIDFLGGNISKIVGLNLGFFCWDNPWKNDIFDSSDALRSAIYYNVLLMVHRTITRLGLVPPGCECPIYAQDSLIRGDEAQVLSHHCIGVLSAAYGHQQGFTEIDDNTMVVHLSQEKGDSSLLGLIMDIATPAAIFWPNGICQQDRVQDYNMHLKDGVTATAIYVPGFREKVSLVLPSCNMYVFQPSHQRSEVLTPCSLPDYERLANYLHNPMVTNDLEKEGDIDPAMFGLSPTIHVRRPSGSHGRLPDTPLAPSWTYRPDRHVIPFI